jgi:DNA-nicking Smr family endonuclease
MSDDGETIRGHRTGLSRTERELARGRFQVLEQLDLHGLRVDESEKALARFLDRVRGPVRSAVLIVHGKGTHSPGGRAVLRGEIARWLSTAPLAHHVLCFATARAADGGAGATYVLLAARRR